MIKIGSDQTSGHTSGDELETTTSSDIEVISRYRCNYKIAIVYNLTLSNACYIVYCYKYKYNSKFFFVETKSKW